MKIIMTSTTTDTSNSTSVNPPRIRREVTVTNGLAIIDLLPARM
jgi:hypothetical protein